MGECPFCVILLINLLLDYWKCSMVKAGGAWLVYEGINGREAMEMIA
jgi:hypothetical protein